MTETMNALPELKELFGMEIDRIATEMTEAKPAKVKKGKAKKAPSKAKGEAKPAKATDRPLSALGAAYKVLGGLKRPLNCRELVELMAEKKLWVSPTGKTPDLTLSAALQREIKAKGEASRFVKVEAGKYQRNRLAKAK